MSFSRVGPNQTIERGQIRVAKSWRSKERDLLAGIHCSSLDEALFALLHSQTAMSRGTTICTRCQKVFSRSRIRQKFCSRRCGNAVRQTQRRAKQKKNVRDAPPLRPATRPDH